MKFGVTKVLEAKLNKKLHEQDVWSKKNKHSRYSSSIDPKFCVK